MKWAAWTLLLNVPLIYGLWPLPKNLEVGSTFLRLDTNFAIVTSPELKSATLSDLDAAISRTMARLAGDQHIRLTTDRGRQDRANLQRAPMLPSLTLALTKSSGPAQLISAEAVKPLSSRNERYSLSVPHDGSAASIIAETSLGLLRGLTTFEQLWYWINDEQEEHIYCHQAPVTIKEDSPSFPYRGFHLDTSRNFYPVEDLKRTLDAMSMVKMSMLQWHVVDSQSFPLDIPGFLELSHEGAYSLRERYSVEDVQETVKYAAERGIDILMEIDTPGHTTSVAASHPEHIACPNFDPWNDYALEPPAGQLRIASPETTRFTASLLKNIAETLPSTMFGTGGDEINMRCYLEDEQTQKLLKDRGLLVNEESINLLLDEFIEETHGVLRSLKKTPVVWEEIALAHGLKNLGNDTIVTIWKDSERALDAINKGFRVVLAPSNYFYLDCGAGGWLSDWVGGNSWCDPYKTWQKVYSFDPLDSIKPEQEHLVLGGQQLLWSEQSSPENLDSIVWPRAAVSAEVFWTDPRRGAKSQVSNEALARLHDLRYRMVARGIKAVALQPYWCAIQPEKCSAGSRARVASFFERSSQRAWRLAKKYSTPLQGVMRTFDRLFEL